METSTEAYPAIIMRYEKLPGAPSCAQSVRENVHKQGRQQPSAAETTIRTNAGAPLKERSRLATSSHGWGDANVDTEAPAGIGVPSQGFPARGHLRDGAFINTTSGSSPSGVASGQHPTGFRLSRTPGRAGQGSATLAPGVPLFSATPQASAGPSVSPCREVGPMGC